MTADMASMRVCPQQLADQVTTPAAGVTTRNLMPIHAFCSQCRSNFLREVAYYCVIIKRLCVFLALLPDGLGVQSSGTVQAEDITCCDNTPPGMQTTQARSSASVKHVRGSCTHMARPPGQSTRSQQVTVQVSPLSPSDKEPA